MSEVTKELPSRDEIPEHLTWELENIFETDRAWDESFQNLQKEIPKIETFQGTLHESAEQLYKMFQMQDEIGENLGKLFTYARMRYDQDTTNSFYQEMYAKIETILTMASQAMSYIVPEILMIDEEKINEFVQTYEPLKLYEHTLNEVLRQKEHTLSQKEEEILALASEPLQSASQTFSMLNNADLKFPAITDERGNEVDVTHGRYVGFLESKDRRVRHDAFKAMYSTYDQFKHTFATTLTSQVKKDNFYATVRNYDSARQAALSQNNIPEQVYDNLVAAINEKLPVLHRYVALRKKVLQLDEMNMYDMYVPLVKDVEMTVSYEEAKEHVLNSLQPLGESYINIAKEGFANRWIDVMENKGKRSGAYSSGAYGTDPYILLNWQNKVNDMFTLTHELGHSVHSYYTRKHQPFRYGNYSIFVAEVASTANEALLNDYMINHLDDAQEKLYLLNYFLDGFRATVFRQTMFAEFEHDIHQRIQQGEGLTAESLTDIYYDLNKKYYGDAVTHDEEIGLEWARIPHFYYNYYVYQYATGYAAATALSKQIIAQDEQAVSRYIDFLKAGNSDYPIEVLKKAGVDMTAKQPIIEALNVFEEKLNELEALLAENK